MASGLRMISVASEGTVPTRAPELGVRIGAVASRLEAVLGERDSCRWQQTTAGAHERAGRGGSEQDYDLRSLSSISSRSLSPQKKMFGSGWASASAHSPTSTSSSSFLLLPPPPSPLVPPAHSAQYPNLLRDAHQHLLLLGRMDSEAGEGRTDELSSRPSARAKITHAANVDNANTPRVLLHVPATLKRSGGVGATITPAPTPSSREMQVGQASARSSQLSRRETIASSRDPVPQHRDSGGSSGKTRPARSSAREDTSGILETSQMRGAWQKEPPGSRFRAVAASAAVSR